MGNTKNRLRIHPEVIRGTQLQIVTVQGVDLFNSTVDRELAELANPTIVAVTIPSPFEQRKSRSLALSLLPSGAITGAHTGTGKCHRRVAALQDAKRSPQAPIMLPYKGGTLKFRSAAAVLKCRRPRFGGTD